MKRWIRRHPVIIGALLLLVAFLIKPALGGLILFGVLAVWLVRRHRTPKPSKQKGTTPPASVPVGSPAGLPTLGDVLSLTPAQFEETTRDLLTALGYQAMTRTGGSGDLGVDLTGRDRQGRSVVCQCKRFAPGHQVGTPLLQSFIGMMTVHHHAERGVFVTTVGYTQPAIALARQHGIVLIDGAGLLLLLGLTGVLSGSGMPAISAPRLPVNPGIPNPALAPRQPLVAASFIPAGSPVSLEPNGPAVAVHPARSPKHCSACGAGIDDDTRFCSGCGAKIKRFQA